MYYQAACPERGLQLAEGEGLRAEAEALKHLTTALFGSNFLPNLLWCDVAPQEALPNKIAVPFEGHGPSP